LLGRFFDLAFDGFRADTFPVRNDLVFDGSYLAENLSTTQCRLFDRAIQASDPVI
jgi:hypothetical protein